MDMSIVMHGCLEHVEGGGTGVISKSPVHIKTVLASCCGHSINN